MTIDIDGLSPKARVLADKLGHKGEIAEALKQDPSLIEGLDEYQRWRDQKNNQEGQEIGHDSCRQPVSHEIGTILKGVKLPPQRRKKK